MTELIAITVLLAVAHISWEVGYKRGRKDISVKKPCRTTMVVRRVGGSVHIGISATADDGMELRLFEYFTPDDAFAAASRINLLAAQASREIDHV